MGQPFEHWVGRLCEEFPGHLPSEMWREWLRLPMGTLERLVEYRAYAAVKDARDHAKSREQMPTGPMADLVNEIEFALAEEAMKGDG